MKRLLGLLIIFGSVIGFACQAWAISLTQALDKTSLAYEDKAELVITISWQGGQSAYLFERPLQPVLDKLKVQRFATSVVSNATDAGEVTTKTFTYTLTPTGSGTARIEPISIHYVSWPDSLPGDLVTEAMSLEVSPKKVQPQSGGLLAKIGMWGWVTFAVVILAGAVGGVLLVARRKHKPVVETKSPAARLLEELSELRQETGGDLRRFQTGVYRLLSAYLSDQHQLAVANRSADQIAQDIESLPIAEADKQQLCGWLLRANREKFSPLPLAPGETIRLEAEIRQYFETIQSRT